MQKLSFILIFLFCFSVVQAQSEQDKTASTRLKYLVIGNKVLEKAFTGLQLYNPKTNEVLFDRNADKYFTPASNTKLLTFLTAVSILGDSIPAFHYGIQNGKFHFKGSGDPSFVNAAVGENQKAFEFLKSQANPLVYHEATFEDEKYGAGWMWDDYPYYYQAEKTSFPLYGNLVEFRFENENWQVIPDVFDSVQIDNNLDYPVKRKWESNVFAVNPSLSKDRSFSIYIPFKTEGDLFQDILQDTLGRSVEFSSTQGFFPNTFYSAASDSLYHELLHVSDNFIADQLLLLCSDHLFDTLSTERMIRYAKDSLFADLADDFVWVDGSGLSRYNMNTPRNLVAVLNKIYQKLDYNKIKELFATAGEDGELRNHRFVGPPFVYAKTGSMSNKYALSGFVETKRNGVLIFSFMHNNYIGSSEAAQLEIDRILKFIRDNF